MNTIRDNMKDLLRELLIHKGIASQDRAGDLACEIADSMGLDGPEGDVIGRPRCAILSTIKGITTLYYKPSDLPVIWIDFDRLRKERVDAVEVF